MRTERVRESGRRPTANAMIIAALSIALGAIGAAMAQGAGEKPNISGTLATYHGQPAPGQQIHFEDRVTHDIFLVHTGAGGGFELYLPPGKYTVRLERGAIVGKPIRVGADSKLDLGRLTIPAPLYPPRLFELQGIGESIVKSAAPSTANLPSTHDAPLVQIKPLPAAAPSVSPPSPDAMASPAAPDR